MSEEASQSVYFCCEYCGTLFSSSSNHECTLLQFQCYSCGEKQLDKFSKSQASKEEQQRCNECVAAKRTLRFQHFQSRAFVSHSRDSQDLNHQLMYAVQDHNISKVDEILNAGANAEYIRQNSISWNGQWRYCFHKDGTEMPELDNLQPSTPLKMCVFRISDCTEDNEKDNEEIVKLLISKISSKDQILQALDYFESRYGKPSKPSVIHSLLKQAAEKMV
jgi:hypothetical protein